MGHLVVLEAARLLPRLRHLVYASSSSVYGANQALPFSETDRVDTPLSIYAATKRADELMSHAYAHLHGLPQTGLRFFTVYGPWGRPDMAYYSFARAIVAGEPITLYEGGTAAAGLHLHRRHRGRRGGLPGPPAGGGAAGPGAEHRQPPQRAGEHAGRACWSRRWGGGRFCARRRGRRPMWQETFAVDRRHRRADRLCAANVAGRGDSALRGLVQGVARDSADKPADRRLTGRRRVAYIALPPRRTAGFASCIVRCGCARLLGLRRVWRTSEQVSRWTRSCGAAGDLRFGL